MPRAKQSIVWVLLVVLLGLLAWVVYQSIEFYEDTEKSRWSREALRNPYLAATYFLQRSDIQVKEADSLLKLDSLEGVQTVLITDANQVINPRQLHKVLEWLEKGGNLIVTANSLSSEEDLLLQRFGVGVEWYREDDEDDGDEQSLSDSLREYNEKIEQGMTPEEIAREDSAEQSLTTISFGDNIGKLEAAFKTRRVLTHASIDDQDAETEYQPFSWSSSDYGVHLMQFDVGDGLLTIVSDPSIWASSRIGQHHHAYLLWVLISKNGGLAILHPTLRDSMWTLMRRNMPEFLLALALLTLLLLWNQSHRFGRIETGRNTSKRSLNEHFSATANYLWQSRAIAHLLQPLRQQVLRRASFAIPPFSASANDPARQYQIISRHTGMSMENVERAFISQGNHEMTFLQTVRLLKQIENSL